MTGSFRLAWVRRLLVLASGSACAVPTPYSASGIDPTTIDRAPSARPGDEGPETALVPLEPTPSAPVSDAGPTEGAAIDENLGAPSFVFRAPTNDRARWRSINGATLEVRAGIAITAFAATHPIVVPSPQPAIPSDDYTVTGTVFAPNDAEFGVLVRVQDDDSGGVLLGSKYGQEHRPFVGRVRRPEFNPSDDGRGPTYAFAPGARYRLKLRAAGATVQGKMWKSTAAEPESFQVTAASPWASGRGIGFYTYGATSAVLESLVVTVP